MWEIKISDFLGVNVHIQRIYNRESINMPGINLVLLDLLKVSFALVFFNKSWVVSSTNECLVSHFIWIKFPGALVSGGDILSEEWAG